VACIAIGLSEQTAERVAMITLIKRLKGMRNTYEPSSIVCGIVSTL
jgi:hypothetical protein